MKILSYFPILFLCSLWGVSSSAQADFAPIGAKWHYSYFNSNQNNFYGYILQEVVKDTIIGDQECRKLERMRVGVPRHDQSAPVDTVVTSTIYVYSSPDTVFYYNEEFKRFLPLYIFNVEKGDTMTYHVPFILPWDEEKKDTLFQVLVTNVTYKDIDGQQLKVIHTEGTVVNGWGFDANSNVSYTEKLGTEYANLLCHNYGTHTGAYHPSTVRCYSDSTINYEGENCTKVRDDENAIDHLNTKDYISIYPNPVSNKYPYVNIAQRDQERIKGILLYDITGKELEGFEVIQNSGSVKMNLSKLNPGLYFLKVILNDQSIITHKIIKN